MCYFRPKLKDDDHHHHSNKSTRINFVMYVLDECFDPITMENNKTNNLEKLMKKIPVKKRNIIISYSF